MRIGDAVIGQYYPGASLIHRADPRLKISGVCAYVVALFFAGGFAGLLVMGAGLLAALLAARIPPRWLLRSVRPVLLLVAITFLFQLLLHGGGVWARFGPLTFYADGARTGGYLALRLLLLVLASVVLSFTTPPVLLTDGLGRMMAPLSRIRFPAYELALMMTIALRFIPTLMQAADRIIKAQTARGGGIARGGIARRARGLLPVLIPLFILSFRNADDLAVAMESRCWRGGRGRTSRRRLKLGSGDALLALLVLLVIVAALVAGRLAGF